MEIIFDLHGLLAWRVMPSIVLHGGFSALMAL